MHVDGCLMTDYFGLVVLGDVNLKGNTTKKTSWSRTGFLAIVSPIVQSEKGLTRSNKHISIWRQIKC